MLRSTKDFNGYTIAATDGELGDVHDLYFDDESWVMRYVIVDTGKWLPGWRVLISPMSVLRPDWVSRRLEVSLNRDQVKNSPPIDTQKPVSRQQELQHLRYYGFPYYWGGPGIWGPAALPAAAVTPPPRPVPDVNPPTPEDRHLRSCREVAGYHIHATDGELGKIDDFLFDDLDWAIRYVVVDTSRWWFGRNVLIPPEWIDGIDWAGRAVLVEVTRAAVEHAPRYDAVGHVNRQWEADYYEHHKRPGHWLSPERARAIKARLWRAPVVTK